MKPNQILRKAVLNNRALLASGVLLGILLTFQNCGQFQPLQIVELASQGGPDDVKKVAPKIPLPSALVPDSIHIGEFVLTEAGKTRGLQIKGRAMLIRGEGKSRVDVFAGGLATETVYSTHVHVAACSSGAGGHYKIDDGQTAATRENEMWPDVTTDATGWGYGTVEAAHVARPEASSVVIHGSDGVKIACADLKPAASTPDPKGAPFSPLVVDGPQVIGAATLSIRISGQTSIRLAVKGLSPSAMYMSHLHAAACEDGAGGGHYKIDPTIATTVEANELWMMIPTNTSGIGLASVVSDHTVREAEAKSVVIHGPDGAKLVCANLDATVAQGMLPTETGLNRYTALSGSASISHSSEAKTSFTVSVSGLTPNKEYISHVHNRPCGAGGGGHYKFDETIAAGLESNEVFFRLTTDELGASTATMEVPHTARPDATSIVVHDPDGAKIACADL